MDSSVTFRRVDFLCRCKAVLGVESGSSIVDPDGDVERLTREFVAQHPGVSYAELHAAVLARYEGNIQYRAIAPRHLEAAAAGTVQVMYPGEFSGVFRADEHYIPLQRDFSNLDDVLAKLGDADYCRRMAERAIDEIICNPALGYRAFAAQFDAALEQVMTGRQAAGISRVSARSMNLGE